jgi:hypothetical protein
VTADPAPLPGLPEVVAAGRPVVECRDCGRPLTGREARSWGRGRACRHKHGDWTIRRPGRFDIEQDGLPGT